jgi:hypothetical protein
MASSLQEKAREGLQKLFEVEEIRQVVCVDDQYREYPDDAVDNIIAYFTSLGDKTLKSNTAGISDFKDIIWDDNIWREQLKEIWDDADVDKRKILSKKIIEKFPKIADDFPELNDGDDAVYADKLKNILGPLTNVEFKEISFSKWENTKDEYLIDKVAKKTLFLFDRNFEKEERRKDEGLFIIRNLQEKNKQVVCGLLSHTFQPQEEYKEWIRLSEQNDIDKDRFILISKERLNEDHIGFAGSIRRTLMNKYCKKVISEIPEIITRAFDEAKKEIDKLEVYDFEDIVFRSSLVEGVWELDTLFRLYNLYQKQNAREQALNKESVRENVERIRSISSIDLGNIENRKSELWKIQRRELYEDGEYINGLYMPIELGDIFQKTEGGDIYILITQPCNLMVRKGVRPNNAHEVTVAKIVKNQPRNPESFYKLLYFDRDSRDSHFVDFRKTFTVQLCILDLCVFNKDGLSRMSVSDTCPDSVIPSWKLRFEKLKRKVEKIVGTYKKKEMGCKDKQLLDILLPRSSHGGNGIFKANIELQKENEAISYTCRRIGRLCLPRAGEMLTKYAQYISRSAFEHDFENFRREG